MSFVVKNYKNGDTLYASDMNNLVSGISENTAAISQKANTSDTYTKSEVDAKLSSVYKYKGSVATFDELPDSAESGDVYNVEDTGDNYAWNGTAWDKLAATVDLSNYLTTEAAAETYLTQEAASTQFASNEALQSGLAEKQPKGEYATIAQLNEGLATKLDSETASEQFASKEDIPVVPAALPNPNALTIKYNGQTAFTYDGSAAETGNFIVNLETVPVSEEEATSAKEYIDSLQVKSVYNLGDFATSSAAESAAAATGVFNNKDYAILVYTVNGKQNGQIINNIAEGKTTQFLYWNGKRYTRTITSGDEVQVSAWASDDGYVALPNRAVMPTLFSLTTSADSDTVKAALTSPLSKEAITLDDLNKCLQLGYTLREYSMQTGSVFVGFNGNAFTLTYVGFANPVQDPAIMSIAINITEDGIYSVTRNATKGIAITSANIAANTVVSNIASTAAESESAIAVLQTQIKMLQDQVQQLKTPAVEAVEVTQEAATISEPEKDVSFNSTVDSYVATITAKSIQSNNAMIESGRLSATAENGDVSIKNLSTSGTLAKSVANAGLSVNTDEYVTINSVNWQQTGYNAIEVGLSSAPKSVLIDGIDFAAKMDNNAISVFDWQENAVITISNCHFADVSNALRISNRSNKPATLNIVNCTVDKWTSGEYAGFICMQDFTSGSAEAAQEANQFGKLTINFVNTTGPNNVKIIGTAKDLVENHQIYLYTDWENIIAYSEETASRFPQVIAK